MEEPSRLLTTRFGTVAPSGKSQSEIPQSIIELPIQIETWIPDEKKRMETLRTKFVYGCMHWAWLVGVSVGRGECLTIGVVLNSLSNSKLILL